MSIIQNIEEFTAARRAVEAHCMCARLEEAAGKLIIYYPEGDFRTAGLRIERVSYLPNGKVVEFTRSIYRGDAYDFAVELKLADDPERTLP